MKKQTQSRIFTLTCLALLIAMQIVLARYLVIPLSQTLRFSMSFIPVVIAARRFGILGGAAVYGIGDFLGAVAIPTTGAYFPGFTLTAVISGAIYGIFLGKKSGSVRIILSVLLSQTLCSLLLNSFWNAYLMGTAFWPMVASRIPQCIIMTVVQIVFMLLFLEKINGSLKKIV